MDLIERMLGGDRGALAQLITRVEGEGAEVPQLIRAAHPHLGKAFSIGITGPPGAGKSSLVDCLTAHLRRRGQKVGIIAADPTSPFTGGALLGDRIRMQQHYTDPGVFIRSMATRGSRGGLPKVARNIIKLLDAFGKDFILVETVGVGQTELDIIEAADSVVVVLVPEAGDTIQVMKAGLLEIADILVVNKADREGASYLAAELTSVLQARPGEWQVPILTTQAHTGTGVDRLLQEVDRLRSYLERTGLLAERRRQQRRRELFLTIEEAMTSRLKKLVERDGQLTATLERVERGEMDPYSAAREILGHQALVKGWLSSLGEG